MPSIEGQIVKDLGITWKDARSLVVDAQTNLGLAAVSMDNQPQIVEEAARIFNLSDGGRKDCYAGTCQGSERDGET